MVPHHRQRPQRQQVLAGASLSAYSDLLRPLGYTLLCVDYYNAVFVMDEYIHLFGDIPTDDMSAWRAGWLDRPDRKVQGDLQKYLLRTIFARSKSLCLPWLGLFIMQYCVE